MEVKIIYSDNAEKIIDIPDYMASCCEFATSKPDMKAVNVTVKRDWMSKSELPVYREIDDD